jgi:putative ABC transport system permease protein
MREWLARLRDWLRRDQLERELQEELQFHREQLERDALSTGVSAGEARRAAHHQLGNVTRITEAARERWSLPTLDQLQQDVRYALRGLRRSPGFTTVALLTLALGIGANAAMFGIVDRLMFRPYAYLRDPAAVHRIYLQETRSNERRIRPGGVEFLRYQDLTRLTTSFAELAVFTHPMLAIGTGEAAQERRAAVVSSTFWKMFDAPPALGRYFTPTEDTPGQGTEVVVLGYAFWQAQFGGRDVLGERLAIGPISPVIIGVAPRGFTGVFDAEPPAAYLPVTLYASIVVDSASRVGYYTTYDYGSLSLMARRKSGVSLAEASADATAAYWQSWEAEWALNTDLQPASVARPAAIVSAMKTAAGPDPTLEERTALWLMGVAVIVLLIASANVANLFLSRALKRRREIAVRLALGVSRRRLAQQTLLESLILATTGATAALLVAHWGGTAIRRLLLPAQDASFAVFTDRRTLAVVFGMALVVALLTGLAPAIMSARRDLATALKSGARASTSRSRLRDVLLVVQTALSVVLLVGAALFVSSLKHVRALRMGYDAENTLIVARNLRGFTGDSAQLVNLRRTLLEAAQAIPGVAYAATAHTIPLMSASSTAIYVPGVDSVARFGQFSYQLTTPDYFSVMGTRIRRGRGLTAVDDARAPRVAVVSESMARVLWPRSDALGQCFRLQFADAPCTTVVGIAEDIVQRQNQLGDASRLHYYLPIEQFNPHRGTNILLRMRADAASQQELVRTALQPLMPGQSYVTVRPFSEVVEGARRSWRLGATLFVAFGALALAVAAVGLYGVVAYNVAQRMHELRIRVALGAQRRHIISLVMSHSVRFCLIGVMAGGALALAGSEWIQPLLFRQSARDPMIYATIGAIMLVIALIAAAAPGRRAVHADPNGALRTD